MASAAAVCGRYSRSVEVVSGVWLRWNSQVWFMGSSRRSLRGMRRRTMVLDLVMPLMCLGGNCSADEALSFVESVLSEEDDESYKISPRMSHDVLRFGLWIKFIMRSMKTSASNGQVWRYSGTQCSPLPSSSMTGEASCW